MYNGLEMLPEHKEQWIEALESGNYEQCQGRLYDGFRERFCCLGVFAEIKQVTRKAESDYDTIYIFECGKRKFREEGLPPITWFSKFFTFKRENSYYEKHESVGCLLKQIAAINDDKKSFKEIAEWIRDNL